MTHEPVRSCIRCIMNTEADPSLTFDESGLCHHCRRYDDLVSSRVLHGAEGTAATARLVEAMKRAGRGREYDCIVGVSGGLDSTYSAYLVHQHGLRALAVHVDNGWNSELAVRNIERVLKHMGMDLLTEVLDWEEFRDLQVAFLRASTPDGEIPTDHAISAVLWREAARRGIRYIVSGMNFTTESISVPDWAYGHSDWRYVKDVHRRHGTVPLRTFPHFGLGFLLYVNAVKRVRIVSFLNYIDYRREDVLELLQRELGWRPYGGKHHESVYTRFYQGYVLPRKFGIDKRVGHLSDLINAGQLTREEALRQLEEPPYDPQLQAQDREYVCKKLGLSPEEFDRIMAAPARSFREYRNSYRRVQLLRRTVNQLRGAGLYPR